MNLYPTPFTTWVVSISSEQNPGLDLSNLASIELLFSGSLVTSTTADVRKEQNFFETLKTKTPLLKSINASAIVPTKKMKITEKVARKKNSNRGNNNKHILVKAKENNSNIKDSLSQVVVNESKSIGNVSEANLVNLLNNENPRAKETNTYVEKSNVKKTKSHVKETNPHVEDKNSRKDDNNSHMDNKNSQVEKKNHHVEGTDVHAKEISFNVGENSEAADFPEIKNRKKKPIITWLG